MQERRTIVRIPHRLRVPYCPVRDTRIRDGKIEDLSERGARLVTREDHAQDEKIAVSVPLSGMADTVTLTGRVRWSLSPLRRRHVLGVEWLLLEEPTRRRLHQFLLQRSRETGNLPSIVAVKPALRPNRLRRIRSVLFRLALALIIPAVSLWIFSLRDSQQQLLTLLNQREALVQSLSNRALVLQEALGSAQVHLSTTTGEVNRLTQEADTMDQQVQQLAQDVAGVVASHQNITEQRALLIKELQQREEERSLLAQRLLSPQELAVAIQEAIARREKERRESIQKERNSHRPLRQNQGYLVGRPPLND
ncbi:MAG: PilZ domain-containing protein [Candidatus Omnitrophica bacterium]|nr:PilZ domain-containing protein [Candidatus Omnitrophota bacterium]MBI3009433.1 PilZ domain-containing protein [Candidatus Omnitrophota bacterium]